MNREQLDILIEDMVNKKIMAYLDSLFGIEVEKDLQIREDVKHDKQSMVEKEIDRLIAEERKKNKVKEDDPADVFGKHSAMPLFCVGCGVTFEPDEMVDIVHIIPYVGDEYNAYYHYQEIKSFNGAEIKDSRIIATKKASEIINDLNHHREAREREPKTEEPKRHRITPQEEEKMLDIIKASDKPLSVRDLYKMQIIYHTETAFWAFLDRRVKKGVLNKVDNMYSYNKKGE